MRVLLTGATGLLGRNILFELIMQNVNFGSTYQITILGRSKGEQSLAERIYDIIENDGLGYLSIDQLDASDFIEGLTGTLSFIEWDLDSESHELAQANSSLLGMTFDWFIHAAAITNFQDTPAVCAQLERVNVQGTMNLTKIIKDCKISTAVFVGSVYSCGKIEGIISADTVNIDVEFRNPYEKSKLKAETYFVNALSLIADSVKVIRVSTLCGRVIEHKIGSVSKFDVMYEFGSYILFRKLASGIPLDKIYDTTYDFPVCIPCNPNAGLNIIPADLAAKSIICILNRIPNSGYYNVCSEFETPHHLWLNVLGSILNVSKFDFSFGWPSEVKNREDSLFRRTLGKIFAPYVMSPPMLFSIENTKSALINDGLYLHSVSEIQLNQIFNYAKEHHFGLLSKESSKRLLLK